MGAEYEDASRVDVVGAVGECLVVPVLINSVCDTVGDAVGGLLGSFDHPHLQRRAAPLGATDDALNDVNQCAMDATV